MQVSEIATRVKRTFGDELGAQITNQDIYRWINDGMRELALSNDLLQKKAATAVTSGTPEYTLPADILTLHSVKYNGQKLQGLSMQEFDELITVGTSNPTGTPLYFYIWAGKISLYPSPDSDSASALVLYYTKIPTEVGADVDTPEVPVQYHNRLVEYCVAQAALSDDNLQLAQLQMGQFKAGAADAKDNQSWQMRDVYPTITVLDEDIYY